MPAPTVSQGSGKKQNLMFKVTLTLHVFTRNQFISNLVQAGLNSRDFEIQVKN